MFSLLLASIYGVLLLVYLIGLDFHVHKRRKKNFVSRNDVPKKLKLNYDILDGRFLAG